MNGQDPLDEFFVTNRRHSPNLSGRGGVHGEVDAILNELRIPATLDDDGDWKLAADIGTLLLMVDRESSDVVAVQMMQPIDELESAADEMYGLLVLNYEARGVARFGALREGGRSLLVLTARLEQERLTRKNLQGLLRDCFRLSRRVSELLGEALQLPAQPGAEPAPAGPAEPPASPAPAPEPASPAPTTEPVSPDPAAQPASPAPAPEPASPAPTTEPVSPAPAPEPASPAPAQPASPAPAPEPASPAPAQPASPAPTAEPASPAPAAQPASPQPQQPQPAAPASPPQPTQPQPAAQPQQPQPVQPQPAAQPQQPQPVQPQPAAQPQQPQPVQPVQPQQPQAFPRPAPAAPQPPPQPALPPANWYPDPHRQARLRYWDGQRWTQHVAN